MAFPTREQIRKQVTVALTEDLGGECNPDNDLTANLIPQKKMASAVVITREPCVVCGIDWATQAFSIVDPTITLQWQVEDGEHVQADTVLVKISGPARGILTAERTALNFLQTLSGTATQTATYAHALKDSDTRILDTRKTLPGLRLAQKYAVACGGGKNHRIGLFDAYLIKENHISSCGSIASAVGQARTNSPDLPVEVEVENLDELQQAIDAGADIVMLDNFTNEQIQSAVDITKRRCKLEVSGNITLERLESLSNLGVDYISSGALTKHVSAVDLSLRIALDSR